MPRPALSASRTVAVLNYLAAHPTEGFTLSDLSQRLGINGASAHALMGVLVDAGYLVRHSRLRTYTLGPAVIALGSAALESQPVVDIARDVARDLARATGFEVAVTAAAGDHIAFLARAGEPTARGVPVHVGQRVPFKPPLGSVFAAWGGAERWLAGRPDEAALRDVLALVRARGYSVALQAAARQRLGHALNAMARAPSDERLAGAVQELVEDLGRRRYQLTDMSDDAAYDVSMITAPVFDATGHVVLALTLQGFTAPKTGAEISVLGERVRDAALAVTMRSHGQVPAVTDETVAGSAVPVSTTG